VALLGAATRPAIAKQMNSWRLLPRDEHTTELYLTDYRHVRTEAVRSSKQAVEFTVHNLEHRPTTYHYTITASPEETNVESRIDADSFTLAPDQFAKISKPLAIATNGRVLVKVILEYTAVSPGGAAASPQTQLLHYWLAGRMPTEQKARP